MKKHLLFSLLVLFSAFAVNAQTTVIEAKQVKAVDSLKLKTDWITNIIKDSSLSGATVRNFPSTDAVVKYIANRLAHTVKYTDTAAIISGYVRELRFLDSLTAVQNRIQGKLTKSDADTYYPAIQRVLDSLTAVQTRIQSKLTKSDADTYYPAIQRMIDSLSAVQTRIQSKLTKSDADTYYPAIQRMIDSLTAVQTRIQGKLTKSDADTYYPAIQRVLDSLTAVQTRIQTKQPLLGYTAENSANKATDFSTVNNVLYPTVQAVSTYIQSALTGVLKDRGNYDASGNTFPASGGSGSGGAIKTGDMWYISVGGTLGGKSVTAGAWVRSLADAPGQTAGNWAIADGGFGFVPENVANKSTNTSLGTSNTAYPSQNAVKTYVDNATANAGNWDIAYNKRPSSASISSSTFTLTLGDGTTVTASIPTFNQNTSGNAATATNATQWNNQAYGGIWSTGNRQYVMTYNQDAGNWQAVTLSNFQSWIGLNNSSTLTNSISGNAATATNATQWSGNNYNGSYSTGGIFGFMINNNTTAAWERATVGQVQTALNLGSYAYRSSGLAELSSSPTFTGTVTAPSLSAGQITATGPGGSAVVLYGSYSGSPANAGMVINNYLGTTTFSHNSNGGATTTTGTMTASSYTGAGTGLTGLASNLTAGYLHNRYWNTDANNIWQSGVYTFYNGTNVPGGDFGMLSIPVFSGSDGSNRYNFQIGSGLSGDPKYRITNINGVGTWYTILTEYNYTSYAMAGAGYSANQNLNTNSNVGFANVTGQHFSNATTTVTSNYTIADGIGAVLVNPSSNMTVTMPSASSWTGRVIYITRTCNLSIGVSLSGVSNLTSLPQGGGAIIVSIGGNWWAIATFDAAINPCA